MRSGLLAGFALFRDGFHRDLAMLLVVTVVAVSVLAAGVAWAVNAYFGDTVAGVIGEFGQFDFVLHVREEAKTPFAKQLATVLHANFPGARVKAGVTVAGKSNFFVAIPKEYRNRQTMENIDTIFGSLPGYSGRTIMVEPSLAVRGVQTGARQFFLSRFERIPGVAFAFAEGGDVTLVLTSKNHSDRVEREVREIVNGFQVVEVRLPMGFRADNIAALGAKVAEGATRDLGATTSMDVSVPDRGDDLQSFTTSLVEMRRFLTSYASEVIIYPSRLVPLTPGEELAVTGGARRPLTAGAPLDPKNVRILVTEVGEGIARGLIVRGDTSEDGSKLPLVSSSTLKSQPPRLSTVNAAFKVAPGSRAGQTVGPVTIHNQRYQLVSTVDDSIKLLKELQVLAENAGTTAARVQSTLDSYEDTLGKVTAVQTTLTNVNRGISGPLDGMARVPTGEIVTVLNRAVGGINDLLENMTGVRDAQASLDVANQAFSATRGQLADGFGDSAASGAGAAGDPGMTGLSQGASSVAGTVSQLGEETASRMSLLDRIVRQINPVTIALLKWRDKINQTAVQIQNFGEFSKDAGSVTELLSDVGQATDSTLDVMRRLDVDGLKTDISEISERMQALRQIDVAAVTDQMAYVKTSLPNLRDDELGRSIRLIDRYIGGQVIPGERVVLLVDRGVNAQRIGDLVEAKAGVGKVATYVLPAGTLQPDARGVLFGILGKVRTTIAGIVALVLVAATLLLDHTLVISALRQTRQPQSKRTSGRGRPSWRRVLEVDPATLYGGVVGALLLPLAFLLSGARLPFVPPLALLGLGLGLGLVTALLAERISPVNSGEFLAAESIGLSYAETLREVVIPEGRPGLLTLLNRPGMRFPERRSR